MTHGHRSDRDDDNNNHTEVVEGGLADLACVRLHGARLPTPGRQIAAGCRCESTPVGNERAGELLHE